MNYFRKIKINDEIIVSNDFHIETKIAKRHAGLPRNKRLFIDSRKGEIYYNDKVVVAKVRWLGAFRDKECTKRMIIK